MSLFFQYLLPKVIINKNQIFFFVNFFGDIIDLFRKKGLFFTSDADPFFVGSVLVDGRVINDVIPDEGTELGGVHAPRAPTAEEPQAPAETEVVFS